MESQETRQFMVNVQIRRAIAASLNDTLERVEFVPNDTRLDDTLCAWYTRQSTATMKELTQQAEATGKTADEIREILKTARADFNRKFLTKLGVA